MLDDDPAKTEAVLAFLERPEHERGPVVVALTTLSEVVYVLRGPRLSFERSTVAALIRGIVALPLLVLDADVVETALSLYPAFHGDWDDCVAAAYGLVRGNAAVLAYDRDFDRIPGLSRIEPPMVTTA